MPIRVELSLYSDIFECSHTVVGDDDGWSHVAVTACLKSEVIAWSNSHLTTPVIADRYFRSFPLREQTFITDLPPKVDVDYAAVLGTQSIRLLFGSDQDRRLFFTKWF